MKVLVYDTESKRNDIYDVVSKYLNTKFTKVKTINEFYKLYSFDSDLLLIIDVSESCGEELFNNITKNKPKQKILVISKTLTYNHSFTCLECDNMFNRKLLLKPLNPKELIEYIENFDNLLCKFSSNSNKIVEIMNNILKQFISFEYDKNSKTIIKKNPETNDFRELVNITEILDIHNIRYIIENQNIKLYF